MRNNDVYVFVYDNTSSADMTLAYCHDSLVWHFDAQKHSVWK